jgi:hypothetical protein
MRRSYCRNERTEGEKKEETIGVSESTDRPNEPEASRSKERGIRTLVVEEVASAADMVV